MDEFEVKADKAALNWMIDAKKYELIKYNHKNIDSIRTIKSFYVYRLAKDNIIGYSSKIYQENNSLIEK